MKLAIIQNADTPQIESTEVQLRAAGYETRWCGPEVVKELGRIGCDTVLDITRMYALGYDRIRDDIRPATLADVERCDLFCEIKVRNVDKIRERWPRLKNKVCWWRVNGAQPEICPRGGDEVNLTCPVITACMWYGTETYRMPLVAFTQTDDKALRSGTWMEWDPSRKSTPVYRNSPAMAAQNLAMHEHPENQPIRDHGEITLGDNGMAYVMWPPYPRSGEYDLVDRSKLRTHFPPYSLCHWGRNWGFGPIVDECVGMGVRFYGNASPHGQVAHSRVVDLAASSLALVHLKSVDCPGWALYEAMLAGCPVVTARLLNSRMLARDLLQHNETCLEYGVPASLEFGRGPMEYPQCVEDVKAALGRLADPAENRRIGENGRRRLNELLWRENKQRPGKAVTDGEEFKVFCERHFG